MVVNNGDDLTLTISTKENITKVKVFTANPNKYILIKEFTKVNDGYNLYISADQLDNLESGVIAYIYYWEKADEKYEDGQYNQSDTVYTDYYYKTDVEPDAPQRYELREYVDDQIKEVQDKLQKEIDKTNGYFWDFRHKIDMSFRNEYVLEGRLTEDATDADKYYAVDVADDKIMIDNTTDKTILRKYITDWKPFKTDDQGYFRIELEEGIFKNFIFKNPRVLKEINKFPLYVDTSAQAVCNGATNLRSIRIGYTNMGVLSGHYMFTGANVSNDTVIELSRFDEIRNPILMFAYSVFEGWFFDSYYGKITGNCDYMFEGSGLTDEVETGFSFMPNSLSSMFANNDITRLTFYEDEETIIDFSQAYRLDNFLAGNNNLKYLGKMPNLGKAYRYDVSLDISMIHYENDDAYADLSGLAPNPSPNHYTRTVKIHKSLYNHLLEIEPKTIAQVKNYGWTFDIVEN